MSLTDTGTLAGTRKSPVNYDKPRALCEELNARDGKRGGSG